MKPLSREEGIALASLIALFAITAAWWALAFWPVHDAPVWLERTRSVCFGVRADGLPDGGGWLGLIGGPLGMLGVVVVGWGQGIERLLQRARTSRPVAATFAGLGLGSILLVGGAAMRVRQARAVTVGADNIATLPVVDYPRLNRLAPPLVLTAHDGTERSLAGLYGRPVLVTFAFAHCETVCPLVVRDALAAQQQLDSTAALPAVLIVTLDPWRDTPSRLASIARQWKLPDDDAWVMGGAVDAVEAVLDAWQVPHARDLRTGAVTHAALVYVIDREGRIAFAATGGAETLARLTRRL